jgi:putative FmdB family regulatory protein
VPTYSYRCASCDYAFDQYQAFTDDTLTVCPNCGEPQLRKVFNSIGVTFNGSGFYRNDSRASTSSDASSSSKPESASPAKSESKTDGASAPKKSESKPAASPKPSSRSSGGSSSGSSGSGSSGSGS